MRANRGFTLVELMVVVVIIGLLAGLAIPRFVVASSKSKATEFKMVLKQVFELENVYFHENDVYTDQTTDLGVDDFPSNPRFTYAISVSGPAYVSTASLVPGRIGTYLGSATIDELGRGGVSGTLRDLSSWSGIGK